MAAFWTPKTMADAGQRDAVKCVCGRTVWPDMMVDVTALPAAITGGESHLCDGCRERLIRTGAITRSALVSALGAPRALVTAMKAANR